MKKPIWHRPLGDDAWMLVKSVCSRRDSSRRTPRVHRDAVRTLRTVVDEVADEDPASWIDKRLVSCVGQSPDRPESGPSSDLVRTGSTPTCEHTTLHCLSSDL
jgi:hypothetical protein